MKKEVYFKGLLDQICKIAGCENLSDLHTTTCYIRDPIIREIGELKLDGYSLPEWNDAVCYICETRQEFKSVEEAAGFLTKTLQRKEKL